jgi:hypothetical protein
VRNNEILQFGNIAKFLLNYFGRKWAIKKCDGRKWAASNLQPSLRSQVKELSDQAQWIEINYLLIF